MKKIYILILICLFSKTINAQVWCTPGSEWYFSDGGFGFTGYKKWNYLYDTLIAGKNCNKIKVISIGFQQFNPQNYNYTNYIYTYNYNKVIYIKDVIQTGTNNFDTLFNYNAAIGSKWRMAPTSLTGCAVSFVTVVDTGRNTIQGQSLKWLKLNYQNNGPFSPNLNFNDTVYERFGALNSYPYWPGNICPWVSDNNSGGPLRCFSDYQIINYKHNWSGNCNYYFTSIREYSNRKNIFKLFPNPANDILNIELKSKLNASNFRLINILGQEIINVFEISETNTQLNLKNIEMGIYFLQLFSEGKLIATEKIIKE